MEKFAKALFSIRMMAVAMFVFFLSIGMATFLESIYDTQTARVVIYNALWFEFLLVFLVINLIANIFRYKMYKAEKIAVLMFHLSFIVIIIGAGATRYFGFEGIMQINEGQTVDYFFSADPYLWVKVNDGKMQYVWDQKTLMSEVGGNYFKHDIDFPNHSSEIRIEFANYRKT